MLVLATATLVELDAWLGIELAREAARVASIWPPDGLLPAILPCCSRRS
jgi:hypothetical protein